MLHYAGPTDHLLIGPPGPITLLAEDSEGTITFEEGQYIQDKPKGGLLRRGGRSSMGNLEGKAQRAAKNANVFLNSHFATDEDEAYQSEPNYIFISDEADLKLAKAELPVPTVHYKKIKDHLRKLPSGKSPPAEEVDQLADEMGLEDPAEAD